MVRKYALNKGYALIDVLTTPTCMIMVASATECHVDLRESRVQETNKTSDHERAKKYTVRWELRDRVNQVENQHNDERWRLGGIHTLT